MEKQQIVALLVGDCLTGRTALVESYMQGRFIEFCTHEVIEDEPRLSFDNYDLVIHETRAPEEYMRLRVLCYLVADVFIFCFALNDRTTFENVKSLWYPEVITYRPEAPLILVGTKLDVEDRCVSREEGLKLQEEINAVFYLECSSKDATNLPEVFGRAAEAYFKVGEKGRKKFYSDGKRKKQCRCRCTVL